MNEDTRHRTRYTIRSRVVDVKERFIKTNYCKQEDGKYTHENVSIGWYVTFEGSWEAVYLGKDKPDLEPGEMSTHTITGDTQPCPQPSTSSKEN